MTLPLSIMRYTDPLRFRARKEETKAEKAYFNWLAQGRPTPGPHIVKQMAVKHYGRAFNIHTFIETGTFYGQMLYAVENMFDAIHSIEIYEPFHRQASTAFKNIPHVTIHLGDSATILPQLLPTIASPCIFWLDGHYSGQGTGRGAEDSPVVHEIETIFKRGVPGDVILIDDARLFDGTDGYPTLAGLEKNVAANPAGLLFCVKDDIIRITPPRPSWAPEIG